MTALEDAKTAFLGAIEAADPSKLVKAKIRTGALDDWFGDRDHPHPIHVIALGKAAPRMVWGLLEASVPFTGIGVTTRGQKKPSLERFWHVGGHPVPDADSFAAGQAVFDFVDRLPKAANVLVLLSGGASACAEVTDDRQAAIAAAQTGLASGEDISKFNARRAALSHFKGGGLARRLQARGAQVRCWVLNDVGPGQERVVGSGPCDLPDVPHENLADSTRLAAAAVQMMQAFGYAATLRPRIEGPIEDAVEAFLEGFGPGKCFVAAGEGTVALPRDAPPGGRTSHAALAAAAHLPEGAMFFAGASDGQDGSGGDAAAWSFAGDEDADALAGRRAHAVLAGKGQMLRLGATGTNLNDVWIAVAPETY